MCHKKKQLEKQQLKAKQRLITVSPWFDQLGPHCPHTRRIICPRPQHGGCIESPGCQVVCHAASCLFRSHAKHITWLKKATWLRKTIFAQNTDNRQKFVSYRATVCDRVYSPLIPWKLNLFTYVFCIVPTVSRILWYRAVWYQYDSYSIRLAPSRPRYISNTG